MIEKLKSRDSKKIHSNDRRVSISWQAEWWLHKLYCLINSKFFTDGSDDYECYLVCVKQADLAQPIDR